MKRTFALLALAAIAAGSGCGGDSDDSAAAKPREARAAVLKIRDTSTPGDWSFDTKRLTAKLGRVTIELHNASGLGHNVRVHTGKCCFKPGYKAYTFLCSIPGRYQTGQHGTLVVGQS